jgi:hypothetical protein
VSGDEKSISGSSAEIRRRIMINRKKKNIAEHPKKDFFKQPDFILKFNSLMVG